MMRKDVERAVKQNRISLEEMRDLLKFYDSGLEGYTYLEEGLGGGKRNAPCAISYR
jgi:arginine decarboxylase-like protein